MRSSSRHHRSSTGHSSSGRSSRTTTSQNNNIIDRRNDLIHRGIDVLPSTNTRHSAPDSSPLFHDHNSPLPSLQRLSAWHTRRGYNLISDLHPHQRTERRSSFADDFYSTSEMSHPYDSDDSHFSHILSPIPRRYDSRFAATTLNSLPVGPGEHELLDSNDNNNSSRTEQRGSASGEVC
ncbi:hypothetical protein C1645_766867 [Glomus cerebriforme]|uniref:Uncharacterized protein n=1 Tax=Glomus cerebriforme TaxID=658196 RepID=A0A397SZT3_9GLOM|nr:hypothetical protein C1645_766867 [Glomus cerebriforme]